MKEALLLDDAPPVATAAMKRDELKRELKYRRSVYSRLVFKGRMSQAEADKRVWILEEILREGYKP